MSCVYVTSFACLYHPQFLVDHLHRVCDEASSNRLSRHTLAECFAHVLVRFVLVGCDYIVFFYDCSSMHESISVKRTPPIDAERVKDMESQYIRTH